MTDYIASRSQTSIKNYFSMFNMNMGDNLFVKSGIVLKTTGTGSSIATMKSGSTLQFDSSSQVTAKDTAFTSTGGNMNVALAYGAAVASYTKYGFYFGGTHNSFIIDGRIEAGGYSSGIEYHGLAAISSGGESFIHNRGSIGDAYGGDFGIILRSGGNEIINEHDTSQLIDGWIKGEKTALDITGSNNKILNSGKIWSVTGPALHLHADAAGGNNTILNTGYIRNTTGTAVLSEGNVVDTLENGSLGSLEGMVDLGGGDDYLLSQGYISGSVRLGAGNDIFLMERLSENPYYKGGTLYGDVYLDSGDDLFDNLNGNHYGSFQGGAGKIYGGDGSDTIRGGAQAELISGGLGNDVLTGRAGKDAFVFDATLGSQNVDLVTDFNVNGDMIHLKASIFSKIAGPFNASHLCLGASAADSSDRIVYNPETGALSYDADGSGIAAAVRFATLSQGLSLTASHFLLV